MTPEEIQAELNKLLAEMDETQAQAAPVDSEKAKLRAEEEAAAQAYRDAVAKVRERRHQLEENEYEINRKRRELDRQKRLLEAQLDEATKKKKEQEAALALQAEYKALGERWDLMTAGAPWREWAKDHQIQGGHKLVMDRNVILADTMGLGKTLTSIITCDIAEAATRDASPEHPFLGDEIDVYKQGYHDPDSGEWVSGGWGKEIINAVKKPAGKKILYFCPSTLLRNVEREFRMWAPHRAVVILGGMAKKERQFIIDMVLPSHPEWVVICNYEAWRKDLSLIDSLVQLDFDTVIIDEAHNVKDTKSIAYRGIKRLIDELKPPYVIPMTGTPILNRPQELFALLTLVNPREFTTINDFLFSYCEQDDDGFWKFKPGGLDRIAKKISKNFLRRSKKDAGIELPEKTITMHNIEVDPERYPNQAKVRDQMRKHAMILLDEKEGKALTAAAMIAVFTRLRQIETWPAGIKVIDPLTKEIKLQIDVEESQKLDYIIHYDKEAKQFEGLIPEVVEDERVVVFSQFKAPLHELKDRIERMGKRAVILDGDTPKSVQDEIRLDFDARHTPNRESSKWDVVLCNYRVGGVGLNLTAATQMVILDEEWNPGKRDQAYDRIHRMGQENPVTIHVIRNALTIDDWLADIMAKKEDLVEGFTTKMVEKDEFQQFLEGMGDSGLL
jgi:SNF2 family DNA or RNA helicase